MNKNFGQSGEKPRINYHIIEIIIFGDTAQSQLFSNKVMITLKSVSNFYTVFPIQD